MAKFIPQDLPAGDESRESHVEFICTHQLAHGGPLCVATQYRSQGRGCLVIHVTKAEDPPPGASHIFGATPGAYVPYKVVRATGDDDVVRMVKEYNPRHEVVFVFLRGDGGVGSCVLVQRIT